MTALIDAAEALWAVESALSVLKAVIPGAASETNAPPGIESAITAMVEVAEKSIDTAHKLAAKHLVDTNQPVPASGGGNKTDP